MLASSMAKATGMTTLVSPCIMGIHTAKHAMCVCVCQDVDRALPAADPAGQESAAGSRLEKKPSRPLGGNGIGNASNAIHAKSLSMNQAFSKEATKPSVIHAIVLF